MSVHLASRNYIAALHIYTNLIPGLLGILCIEYTTYRRSINTPLDGLPDAQCTVEGKQFSGIYHVVGYPIYTTLLETVNYHLILCKLFWYNM